jgi:hypothetical protein
LHDQAPFNHLTNAVSSSLLYLLAFQVNCSSYAGCGNLVCVADSSANFQGNAPAQLYSQPLVSSFVTQPPGNPGTINGITTFYATLALPSSSSSSPGLPLPSSSSSSTGSVEALSSSSSLSAAPSSSSGGPAVFDSFWYYAVYSSSSVPYAVVICMSVQATYQSGSGAAAQYFVYSVGGNLTVSTTGLIHSFGSAASQWGSSWQQ